MIFFAVLLFFSSTTETLAPFSQRARSVAPIFFFHSTYDYYIYIFYVFLFFTGCNFFSSFFYRSTIWPLNMVDTGSRYTPTRWIFIQSFFLFAHSHDFLYQRRWVMSHRSIDRTETCSFNISNRAHFVLNPSWWCSWMLLLFFFFSAAGVVGGFFRFITIWTVSKHGM